MPRLLALPTPFPVGPVNVYLLEGDPLTLVDCGPKHPDSMAALERGLAACGHRLEDIRQLVLTHHHVDHIGLARAIVERSGAAVLAHPYNVPYLADYDLERRRHLPFYHQIWAEGGVPEDVVAEMEKSGRGFSRWLDPVEVSRTIDEGDTLLVAPAAGDADGPPGAWRVYHTPGHAGGMVCLHNPASGALLTSDHLLLDISSNPVMEPPAGQGPRPKRLVDYLGQMKRMAALHPAIAYPGHGDPFEDVAGLVRRRVAFHRRRARTIHQSLGPSPRTVWEIAVAIFGQRLKHGMDYFLAVSEVLGHLDLLADQGRVRTATDGNVVRWVPVPAVGRAHAAASGEGHEEKV